MSGEFRSEHLDQGEAEIELKTIVMQPCVLSSTRLRRDSRFDRLACGDESL